eukprot:3008664-Prymnesium_polylepis.1
MKRRPSSACMNFTVRGVKFGENPEFGGESPKSPVGTFCEATQQASAARPSRHDAGSRDHTAAAAAPR